MAYTRCSCGQNVSTTNRFCPYCGRPMEANGTDSIHALLYQVPFLADFDPPVLISSGIYRSKYLTVGRGVPHTLHVVNCGTDPNAAETFRAGIALLEAMARDGLIPPVRHHLITAPTGVTGFLLEERINAPTLAEHFRKGTMMVADALDLGIFLSSRLASCFHKSVYLDISPDTICVAPGGRFLLNASCVTLSAEEFCQAVSTPFAPPELSFLEENLPTAACWTVAMVLGYLLNNGQLPNQTTPFRDTAPALADCIRQATTRSPRQRTIHALADLRNALEEIRWQLTPLELTRRLLPEFPRYAPVFSPAPVQASRAPMPSAPPAPCAAPPSPAKSQKKGGILSNLFSRKKAAPPTAAPPAPAPMQQPVRPVPLPPEPRACPPAPSFTMPSAQPFSPAPDVYPITGAPSCGFPPVPDFASSAPTMPCCSEAEDYPVTGLPTPVPDFPLPSPPQDYPITDLMVAPDPASFAPAPVCAPPPRVDRVQFSAVAPKETTAGDYAIIQLFMYEQEFRQVVDEALAMLDTPGQEKRSGFHNVTENTRVKVVLTCPDVEIQDNVNEQVWCGGYLQFDFALCLPEDFRKRQVLLNAAIYFDDIPATRLMLIMKASCTPEATVQVTRHDILSAFVSYASQDRARVAGLIQGMRKARPEMDIFFDVTTLRSGEDWEQTLFREILRRDILFLCWSHNAKNSPWVDQEWHYALEHKGIQAIEPIPLEPPDLCPPPSELSKKHFNDSLLYITG